MKLETFTKIHWVQTCHDITAELVIVANGLRCCKPHTTLFKQMF